MTFLYFVDRWHSTTLVETMIQRPDIRMQQFYFIRTCEKSCPNKTIAIDNSSLENSLV